MNNEGELAGTLLEIMQLCVSPFGKLIDTQRWRGLAYAVQVNVSSGFGSPVPCATSLPSTPDWTRWRI